MWFLNILRGAGSARRALLLARALELRPDVIVFAEAEGWAEDRSFAAALGLEPFVVAPDRGLPLALLARPGWCREPQALCTGHLFHAALRARITPPGGAPFELVAAHLHPGPESRRHEEVEALLPHLTGPSTLLVGDLNALDPDDWFRGAQVDALEADRTSPAWLKDRLPPRAIARLRAAGLVDLFRLRRPGEDGSTFPAREPHVRYDYALAGAALAARVHDVELLATDADRALSDHLGLLVLVADEPRGAP